ncbi:hypothetical protein F5X99DRAFT_173846 [Biscogniauxia marginata]|nr:hypothetical protein F5X99DRAFT_173846 [Biscogniauxia marginata]
MYTESSLVYLILPSLAKPSLSYSSPLILIYLVSFAESGIRGEKPCLFPLPLLSHAVANLVNPFTCRAVPYIQSPSSSSSRILITYLFSFCLIFFSFVVFRFSKQSVKHNKASPPFLPYSGHRHYVNCHTIPCKTSPQFISDITLTLNYAGGRSRKTRKKRSPSPCLYYSIDQVKGES